MIILKLYFLRCSLFLKEITPYQIRNLASEKVTFSPGVNVIIGKNGQGKTNLIEAVYILSLTKSFRTSEMSEVLRWGESSGSIFGTLSLSYGDTTLGIALEEKGRTYFVQGEKVKSVGDYLGRLICVAFSPSSLELLQGQPSGRRKFMDKYLVDLSPRLIEHLVMYQRALASKNKILKEERSPRALLSPWNEILAREGAVIISARERLVKDLEERAAPLLKEFSPYDEPLSLKIKRSSGGTTQESLHDALLQNEEKECTFRSSLIGPHRDDLVISLGAHDARSFASQGQSRSIVLALLLGTLRLIEEQRGESPIVLLDDVNSELDHSRSEAFFSMIKSANRQIIITGTDASVGHLGKEKGYHVLQVHEGRMGES